MAQAAYAALSKVDNVKPVESTPQARQQESVIQSKTAVVQENAGQAPPTTPPKAILPYLTAVLPLWLIIILALYVALCFYEKSQDRASVKLKEVVEVSAEGGEG